MRTLITFLSLAILGLVTLAQPGPALAEGHTPRPFPSTGCPQAVTALEDAGRVDCFLFEVPENRENPASRTIALTVARFPSVGPRVFDTPLVMLQGGPGGSMLPVVAGALFGGAEPSYLVRGRDVIVLEQRGTPLTSSPLVCPSGDEGSQPGTSPEQTRARSVEQARACRDALASRADLSAYTTRDIAADLDALRQFLGHDQIDLYGVSYGTYLVQQYARTYAAHTRAVILDAVVPADVNFIPAAYVSFNQSLNAQVAACQADPACAALLDYERELWDLVDRLDRAPVSLELLPPGAEEPVDYVLDGSRLVGLLRSAAYSAELIGVLPLAIAEAGQRDNFTILANIAGLLQAGAGGTATGMYFSVACADFGPMPSQVLRGDGIRSGLIPSGDEGQAVIAATCAAWDVPARYPQSLQAFRLRAPVLVLSGGFDPITPINFGDRAAAMHGGTHVVFPFGAHGQISDPCGQDIMDQFLDRPGGPLDTGCILTSGYRFASRPAG